MTAQQQGSRQASDEQSALFVPASFEPSTAEPGTRALAVAPPPAFFSMSGRIGRLRAFAYFTNFVMAFGLWIAGFIHTEKIGWISNGEASVLFFAGMAALLASFFSILCRRLADMGLHWSMSFIFLLFPVASALLVFVPGDKKENGFGLPPAPNTKWVWIAAIAPIVVFYAAISVAVATSSQ